MNDERPGGSIRIGDSEREDAVRRLGEHYEAGRLSADEHSERVEQALKARTGTDLEGLFADLPGAHQTTAGDDNEAWAGPWGWRRPPWTAPESAAGAAGGPGAGGSGGQRPQWTARGPVGRIPFPLLILLGVAAVMLSVGCTVLGGHPPVLPLLLIVAAVLFVRKRRMEHQA